MKIYIAGKISGLEPEVFHAKFEEFRFKVSNYFRTTNINTDVECIIPTDLCDDDWDWFHCMSVCVDELMTCDAIVMMGDWQDSKGATCEYYIAKAKNIPIYYQDDIEAYAKEKES